MLTKDQVTEALKAVKYPGYSRDIVSFGLLKNVAVHEGEVVVSLQLTSGSPEIASQIKREAEAVLQQISGVKFARVDVLGGSQQAAPQSPFASQSKVAGIKRVVAVASGKGGVGKSTSPALWPSLARKSVCWIAISMGQASRS